MKIDVLDHGYVRLVSYTQPVTTVQPSDKGALREGLEILDTGALQHWTGDLEIVRNARVSHNADWRGSVPGLEHNAIMDADKDEKLIHYLMKNHHTSPFEAMVFTFEVQAPIFVFRQWHRHRTWSYNEVSARYTELSELFYVPDPKFVGTQSKNNKQAREMAMEHGWDQVDAALFAAEDFCKDLRDQSKMAFERYKDDLEHGIPRELARIGLPLNTYSRMFGTVNLHNLFRFLELRLDAHAQYEIRVYAEALLELVKPICPIAVAAWEEHRRPE